MLFKAEGQLWQCIKTVCGVAETVFMHCHVSEKKSQKVDIFPRLHL
jgi:hypothetical protein